MTLKDYLIYIALGALVFGFVHNNTVAVTTWLRQAFLKLVGWTEREAGVVLTAAEGAFHRSAGAVQIPPPAAQVHAPVSVTVNTGTPAAAAATDDTVNGVPVPTGISYANFAALVNAVQGVRTMLADANMLQAVATATDAWFLSGVGAYYVQQLVAQTSAGTPAGDRVRQFIAAGHPVVEVVTAEQQAAATKAAG